MFGFAKAYVRPRSPVGAKALFALGAKARFGYRALTILYSFPHLSHIFQLSFRFLQLQEYQGAIYQELRDHMEPLGDFYQPPMDPFHSVHPNRNARMHYHLDVADVGICYVQAGDGGDDSAPEFEGADIILHQLGLVVKLVSSMGIFFKSKWLYHANTRVRNSRDSIVLASDASVLNQMKLAERMSSEAKG